MTNKKPVALSLSQVQIQLICDWASGAADNLHDQRGSEWGENENNVLVYGTSDYDEAQALISDVINQLTPHLTVMNEEDE
jgi:hypothetical protein